MSDGTVEAIKVKLELQTGNIGAGVKAAGDELNKLGDKTRTVDIAVRPKMDSGTKTYQKFRSEVTKGFETKVGIQFADTGATGVRAMRRQVSDALAANGGIKVPFAAEMSKRQGQDVRKALQAAVTEATTKTPVKVVVNWIFGQGPAEPPVFRKKVLVDWDWGNGPDGGPPGSGPSGGRTGTRRGPGGGTSPVASRAETEEERERTRTANESIRYHRYRRSDTARRATNARAGATDPGTGSRSQANQQAERQRQQAEREETTTATQAAQASTRRNRARTQQSAQAGTSGGQDWRAGYKGTVYNCPEPGCRYGGTSESNLQTHLASGHHKRGRQQPPPTTPASSSSRPPTPKPPSASGGQDWRATYKGTIHNCPEPGCRYGGTSEENLQRHLASGHHKTRTPAAAPAAAPAPRPAPAAPATPVAASATPRAGDRTTYPCTQPGCRHTPFLTQKGLDAHAASHAARPAAAAAPRPAPAPAWTPPPNPLGLPVQAVASMPRTRIPASPVKVAAPKGAASPKTTNHKCQECGDAFSSAAGLAGHMEASPSLGGHGSKKVGNRFVKGSPAGRTLVQCDECSHKTYDLAAHKFKQHGIAGATGDAVASASTDASIPPMPEDQSAESLAAHLANLQKIFEETAKERAALLEQQKARSAGREGTAQEVKGKSSRRKNYRVSSMPRGLRRGGKSAAPGPGDPNNPQNNDLQSIAARLAQGRKDLFELREREQKEQEALVQNLFTTYGSWQSGIWAPNEGAPNLMDPEELTKFFNTLNKPSRRAFGKVLGTWTSGTGRNKRAARHDVIPGEDASPKTQAAAQSGEMASAVMGIVARQAQKDIGHNYSGVRKAGQRYKSRGSKSLGGESVPVAPVKSAFVACPECRGTAASGGTKPDGSPCHDPWHATYGKKPRVRNIRVNKTKAERAAEKEARDALKAAKEKAEAERLAKEESDRGSVQLAGADDTRVPFAGLPTTKTIPKPKFNPDTKTMDWVDTEVPRTPAERVLGTKEEYVASATRRGARQFTTKNSGGTFTVGRGKYAKTFASKEAALKYLRDSAELAYPEVVRRFEALPGPEAMPEGPAQPLRSIHQITRDDTYNAPARGRHPLDRKRRKWKPQGSLGPSTGPRFGLSGWLPQTGKTKEGKEGLRAGSLRWVSPPDVAPASWLHQSAEPPEPLPEFSISPKQEVTHLVPPGVANPTTPPDVYVPISRPRKLEAAGIDPDVAQSLHTNAAPRPRFPYARAVPLPVVGSLSVKPSWQGSMPEGSLGSRMRIGVTGIPVAGGVFTEALPVAKRARRRVPSKRGAVFGRTTPPIAEVPKGADENPSIGSWEAAKELLQSKFRPMAEGGAERSRGPSGDRSFLTLGSPFFDDGRGSKGRLGPQGPRGFTLVGDPFFKPTPIPGGPQSFDPKIRKRAEGGSLLERLAKAGNQSSIDLLRDRPVVQDQPQEKAKEEPFEPAWMKRAREGKGVAKDMTRFAEGGVSHFAEAGVGGRPGEPSWFEDLPLPMAGFTRLFRGGPSQTVSGKRKVERYVDSPLDPLERSNRGLGWFDRDEALEGDYDENLDDIGSLYSRGSAINALRGSGIRVNNSLLPIDTFERRFNRKPRRGPLVRALTNSRMFFGPGAYTTQNFDIADDYRSGGDSDWDEGIVGSGLIKSDSILDLNNPRNLERLVQSGDPDWRKEMEQVIDWLHEQPAVAQTPASRTGLGKLLGLGRGFPPMGDNALGERFLQSTRSYYPRYQSNGDRLDPVSTVTALHLGRTARDKQHETAWQSARINEAMRNMGMAALAFDPVVTHRGQQHTIVKDPKAVWPEFYDVQYGERGYAEGGSFKHNGILQSATPKSVTIVGERGPEAYVEGQDGRSEVVPHQKLSSFMGSISAHAGGGAWGPGREPIGLAAINQQRREAADLERMRAEQEELTRPSRLIPARATPPPGYASSNVNAANPPEVIPVGKGPKAVWDDMRAAAAVPHAVSESTGPLAAARHGARVQQEAKDAKTREQSLLMGRDKIEIKTAEITVQKADYKDIDLPTFMRRAAATGAVPGAVPGAMPGAPGATPGMPGATPGPAISNPAQAQAAGPVAQNAQAAPAGQGVQPPPTAVADLLKLNKTAEMFDVRASKLGTKTTFEDTQAKIQYAKQMTPARAFTTQVAQIFEQIAGRSGIQTRARRAEASTSTAIQAENMRKDYVAQLEIAQKDRQRLVDYQAAGGTLGKSDRRRLDQLEKVDIPTANRNVTEATALAAATKKKSDSDANLILGRGDVAKNVAVGFMGLAGATVAMKAAFTVLNTSIEAAVEGVSKWVEAQSGFGQTTSQMNTMLGTAVKQQDGNTKAVIASTLAMSGLNSVTAEQITPALSGRAQAIAGNQAAQQRMEQIAAANGEGGLGPLNERPANLPQGYDQNLVVGTGGLLNWGIGPGSTAPTAEVVQQELGKARYDRSTATVVPNNQIAGRENEGMPGWSDFINFFSGSTTVITQDAKELSKSLNVLNDQAESAGNTLKMVASSGDAVEKTAKAFEDIGAGQLAGQIRKSQVAINGGDLTKFQAADWLKAQATFTPNADELAQTMERPMFAQRMQLYRDRQLALQQDIPAATAMQYITQPQLPYGKANLAGGQPAGIIPSQNLLPGIVKQSDFAAQAKAYGDAYNSGFANEAIKSQKIITAEVEKGKQVLRDWGVPETMISDIETLGKDIQVATRGLEQRSLNLTTSQYTNQIRLASRAWQDAKDMAAGVAGSTKQTVGALEGQNLLLGRQSQLLGFGMEQRSINLKMALAGFTAPGDTPEQRQARIDYAKKEADYAQKQLNIQKQMGSNQYKVANLQIFRSMTDAQAEISLLKEARSIAVEMAAKGDQIKAMNDAQALLLQQAQAYSKEGRGAVEIWNKATAEIESRTGKAFDKWMGKVVTGYTAAGEAFGAGIQAALVMPTAGNGGRNDGGNNGPGSGTTSKPKTPTRDAAGMYGTFNTPTTATFGEAGTETVAILRNPRSMMIGSGGGGGGGGTVNVNININGGGDIDQKKLAAWGAQIQRATLDALNRKTALLGLRSP